MPKDYIKYWEDQKNKCRLVEGNKMIIQKHKSKL